MTNIQAAQLTDSEATLAELTSADATAQSGAAPADTKTAANFASYRSICA